MSTTSSVGLSIHINLCFTIIFSLVPRLYSDFRELCGGGSDFRELCGGGKIVAVEPGDEATLYYFTIYA